MIKLLLDQGLPRGVANLLRERGWDVQHVSERGMSRTEVATILRVARLENRVVVTLDADFHALLALAGANKPSVVRIRMQGLKAEKATALIARVLDLTGEELAHGAMVTVSDGKIRVKFLPVTRSLDPLQD